MAAAVPDSLFVSDEILKIELKADFSAIQNERNETPRYHNGELSYQEASGHTVKLPVRVMARGHFRLNPQNCKFPPLMLNFKKEEARNTLFENHDKLKLVTPCKLESYIAEEYLIYKMYNLVTYRSMRVRLAMISYYDVKRNKKLFRKLSFFIEDKKSVTLRNNSFEYLPFITPFDLDQENIKNLSVFQYMIGNKDWFITSRRNIVVMQPTDPLMKPYAVPYDFDLSGLVNAIYGKSKRLPSGSPPPKRVYMGICFSAEELADVFDYFRKLKPQFEAIMNNKLIPLYNRKLDLQYLDSFYDIIGNKDLVKQEFIDTCQTRRDYNLQ
jgi:hypothetical protein